MGCHTEALEVWCVKALPTMLRVTQHDTHPQIDIV